MDSPYRVETELFALPYLDQHIVYAPLRQASLFVNRSALDVLANLRDGRPVDETPENIEFLALLMDLGIVSADTGRRPNSTPLSLSDDRAFAPTACTLFLTSDCNLRCRYCYARGGEDPRALRLDIAFNAISLVVENVKGSTERSAIIAFHGGGEPTLSGERLRTCVEYAQQACKGAGVEPVFALATNGVMSRATREFVAGNFDSVMVSMDGAPSTQDVMRPRLDGSGTFAAVERTLRRFDDAPCRLGVRVTVSSATVDDLVSSVRCILGICSPETIHVEPLFACGRSLENELQPPSPDRFIELFRLARQTAAAEGVDVVYSASRYGMLTNSFCEASGPSFNVTPDGDVTACYEVSNARDVRAPLFVFGRFDERAGAFAFDAEKIASLRRLTVANADRCARCFCKYHCGGDCAAKRVYPGAGDALAGRCTITRRLTQDLIEEALLGSGEDVLAHALATNSAGDNDVVIGMTQEGQS